MLEVIRQEGETIDHLIRRYNDKLRRNSLYATVKAGNFYQSKPTKRQTRLSALYKQRKREKIEYLKRIGKIEETNFGVYHQTSGRKTA